MVLDGRVTRRAPEIVRLRGAGRDLFGEDHNARGQRLSGEGSTVRAGMPPTAVILLWKGSSGSSDGSTILGRSSRTHFPPVRGRGEITDRLQAAMNWP